MSDYTANELKLKFNLNSWAYKLLIFKMGNVGNNKV